MPKRKSKSQKAKKIKKNSKLQVSKKRVAPVSIPGSGLASGPVLSPVNVSISVPEKQTSTEHTQIVEFTSRSPLPPARSKAPSLDNYVVSGPKTADDGYVHDPTGLPPLAEKLDERIKFMLMAIMFAATMIFGVFFFWAKFLPSDIFANKEINHVFLPTYYWSGIYVLISFPWFSSLYCLFLVVYPDPRKWKLCSRQTRWIPYILIHLYTVAVNSYWMYQMLYIPARIRLRMEADINKVVLQPATLTFAKLWVHIHNYYACCGLTSEKDWRNKFVPTNEYPYPFRKTGCSGLKYGVTNPANPQCDTPEHSVVDLGSVWPASCCDNVTLIGCTTLPTSSNAYTKSCLNSEIWMCCFVVGSALFLSIVINLIGIVALWKGKVLESIAVHQVLGPPKSHI